MTTFTVRYGYECEGLIDVEAEDEAGARLAFKALNPADIRSFADGAFAFRIWQVTRSDEPPEALDPDAVDIIGVAR